MYRIAICEDDLAQLNYLKNCVENIFEDIETQVEISAYNSGKGMIENDLKKIDIFLLDIQMEELNGMDVAKILRKNNNNAEIIFVTAIIDYVQEGYKVRAYRYLLKPIKIEELKEHLLSCIDEISKKRDNYIILKTRGKINKIPVDEVTYIEVIRRDIIVHTVDGEDYTVKNSMDNIEKSLKQYNFFRCHKSYLLNIDYVQAIQGNIVTVNREEIPISKYRINELKDKLIDTLGSVLF